MSESVRRSFRQCGSSNLLTSEIAEIISDYVILLMKKGYSFNKGVVLTLVHYGFMDEAKNFFLANF